MKYLLVVLTILLVLTASNTLSDQNPRPVSLDEYGPRVPENYYETISDNLPDDPDYQE